MIDITQQRRVYADFCDTVVLDLIEMTKFRRSYTAYKSRSLSLVLTIFLTTGISGCTEISSYRSIFSITLSEGMSPNVRPQIPSGIDIQVGPDYRPPFNDSHSTNNSRGGGGSAFQVTPPSLSISLSTRFRYNFEPLIGLPESGNQLGTSASNAVLGSISGIALSSDQTLFVCDSFLNQIRAYPLVGQPRLLLGSIEGHPGFVADDTPDSSTLANNPNSLVIDKKGILYYCDSLNHRIRYFFPGGRVYTLAGGGDSDGDVEDARNARLQKPFALALDANGTFFFSDRSTGQVRMISSGGRISTLAIFPAGKLGPIAVDSNGKKIWVGVGGNIYLLEHYEGDWIQSLILSRPEGEVVTGLSQDGTDELFYVTTSSNPFGLVSTRIFRFLNSISIVIAGKIGAESTPISQGNDGIVLDARNQLITSAGFCALVHDQHSESISDRNGSLYFGNNYSHGADTSWGQVIRLTPESW